MARESGALLDTTNADGLLLRIRQLEGLLEEALADRDAAQSLASNLQANLDEALVQLAANAEVLAERDQEIRYLQGQLEEAVNEASSSSSSSSIAPAENVPVGLNLLSERLQVQMLNYKDFYVISKTILQKVQQATAKTQK